MSEMVTGEVDVFARVEHVDGGRVAQDMNVAKGGGKVSLGSASHPSRFGVIGSCSLQKTSSRRSYETRVRSNVTCTDSACPVLSEQTCS